jgi:3-deoxy-D-manno-octulosonic-acid transferase
MENLLLFFYDIGLLAALAVLGPFLLTKKKARAGLSQKFGKLPQSFENSLAACQETVWLHAVSVGEFTAVLPFIKLFHERYPDKKIVISTTTETGNKLALEHVGDFASVFYFPFDLSWVVKTVLDIVHPSIVFMAETELWPCFTNECAKRDIPLVILNGRMSPRSFKSYKLFGFIFAPLLKKFSLIGAQSKTEAQRYESIAQVKLPTIALGNLKYDNLVTPAGDEAALLKDKLGIRAGELVLVAGSTHETEEQLVLEALRSLQSKNGQEKYRLIIAPRHPERFARVGEIVQSFGFRPRYFSKGELLESRQDVYVLDTIGALAKHYSVATVAFVGGTIAKVGGHNLLEPYAYGVPVVCGPYLFKTKETAKILKGQGALLIGKSAIEVEAMIIKLFADQDLRREMGDAGRHWLRDNQGAVDRALVAVERLMIARGLVNPNRADANEELASNISQQKMLQTSNHNRRSGEL